MNPKDYQGASKILLFGISPCPDKNLKYRREFEEICDVVCLYFNDIHEPVYPHKDLHPQNQKVYMSFKGTMSLLQPTSNAVELCRNYEYVMYVLSVTFKR